MLLAVRGLGPRGGSELQVILVEVRGLGPWLWNLGPGHTDFGLWLVAALISWEIFHELVQFCIIRFLLEASDLGIGG